MGILMHTSAAALATLLGAGALAVGCGEIAPEPGEFDAVYRDGSSDLPGDATASGGDASGESATGTWAMATDWSTCVHIGEARFELRTYKLVRVEVEEVGPVWRERRTVCSVVNTALLGQITVFSPAVIQSYVEQTVLSTFSGHGKGQIYNGGLDIQLLGVKLTEPATDAMPSGPGDPRVVDSDGDGKPGGTLLVGQLCQVYAANRALRELTEQGYLARVPGVGTFVKEPQARASETRALPQGAQVTVPDTEAIATRVIHACGMPEIAADLRISDGFVTAAASAIAAGR